MSLPALNSIPAVVGDVRLLATRAGGHIEAIRSFVDDAARSGDHVWGEVYKLANGGVQDALAAVSERGGLTMLADSGSAWRAAQPLVGRDGAQVAAYAAEGLGVGGRAEASFVQHAKGWATERELLFSTASPSGIGVGQVDVSMRLGAEPAAGFRAAVTAGVSGTDDARRAALAFARERGVVFNDPTLGVRYLDDAMRDVIRGARHDLRIMPKEFLEPSWAHEAAAAKARGVDVRVLTRMIDRESLRVLREADIPIETVPLSAPPGIWRTPLADALTWRRLHFSAVAADGGDRVVVGTRYFWEPSAPGERLAREAGVVLGGDAGHQALAHLEESVGRRASIRDLGDIVLHRRD